MDHNLVLNAVQAAFNLKPDQVVDQLTATPAGRVYGVVIVRDSALFDQMSVAERSRLLWDHLRRLAGDQTTNVGVVLLQSGAGMAN
ncbi:MAG: hypothetical protein NT029_09810 [Armatimonadetes bacterium]|nr:hypothetical protein [Armatimonadota bacterium]